MQILPSEYNGLLANIDAMTLSLPYTDCPLVYLLVEVMRHK